MTNTTISLKAELESRTGANEYLRSPGDAVLVTRGTPRWLVLRCPCGCGVDIPVNLDDRAGKAWRLYKAPSTGLTLFPSVWRDTGCESHFIIWRDQILMFGPRYAWGAAPREKLNLVNLSTRVLDAWPHKRQVSYVEVAEELREIPWDVLEACRDLVKAKALIEGLGEQRGSFRRRR
jgi:hypothetical protein